VAIGGLSDAKVETVEDRVPFFSSIPLIGKLFKSNLQRTKRTAVIYFVSVKIVNPAGDLVHQSSDVTDTAPASDLPPATGDILLPAGGK
jgi:general secretion pathway protein D